jgi:transposase InsO family protein
VPWQEVSTVSLRKEFVSLATQPGANIAELCRRFGISRKSGYKWLARYEAQGMSALADRSRRPSRSPTRTAAQVEAAIVRLRKKHPGWGARKLIGRLRALGYADLPGPSTAQAILRRHGLIAPEASAKHQAFVRFEHPCPNSLWQMDFKGHFALSAGGRCHPLTVLDDHSRFNLAIRACANEQGLTVQAELSALFRRYGLPDCIGVDNGSPWGDSFEHPYTPLVLWLIRQQINVWHSRPYHPQTLGKNERFHRTLKTELLSRSALHDLPAAQRAFDAWREVYNFERPHEALEGNPPAARYRPSTRSFRERPTPIEYAPDCQVRKVDQDGYFSFKGRSLRIGRAFHGYPIGLRPTTEDGLWEVYFCHQRIKSIDLRNPESIT